ncbi:MAG: class I SAM-dependent methyltransferase [Acidobacteria bacterium]|nr:class I SAM-dependent methyltransferase [Acidobacteriota bacterium]MYG74825.1 class I SAM-dependent methyltransferase [Acidobacteriota bacterium]
MSTTRSISVELGAVQETLLIPLLARARETERGERGLLHDPRAVEIVRSLDYDFGKWEGGPSIKGACLRARMFDRYVEDFLDAHPGGSVVEIGCGLDTRFDRLDNGRVRWFDLDLPDTIALRRRFFEDGPRRTIIAASVLDSDWMDRVEATGGPWMFVAEAVLIYLEAPEARRAICGLARRFPGARLAFDTTETRMVENQHKHDAMRHLTRASWFRWRCDDPREIESWEAGLRLAASKSFLDADRALLERIPWRFRLPALYAPFLLRRTVGGYRLNLATVDGAPAS